MPQLYLEYTSKALRKPTSSSSSSSSQMYLEFSETYTISTMSSVPGNHNVPSSYRTPVLLVRPQFPASPKSFNILALYFGWLRGSAVERQSLASVLLPSYSLRVTTYVGKLSVIGQHTRPTQPFILSGSINE